MLKVLRDNLKYLSWILWLVIAVFILFVFVDFGATVPGGTAPADAAAFVGKQKISFGEFESAYRRAEDNYRQIYGEQFSGEMARQIGLPMQVLDGLVAEKILLVEAQRMGVRLTDEELRREILRLPAFQEEGGGFVGAQDYEQILRRSGYNVESFENLMRDQLLTDKVRSILAENVFVPNHEIEEAYRLQAEQATIRFIRLPTSSLEEEIALEPAEIEAYFSEHQEDFRIPERRVADYLLVDRLEIQESLVIDDIELEQYYEANQEDFRSEEQVRARHILRRIGGELTLDQAKKELESLRDRINAGEDFGKIAQEVSDDPGSKARGGDLGFFGRGQMVAAFEEAVFGAEPGEIVGPVETDFGVHLIEVLERREGGLQPFDQVMPQIRQQLLAERAQTVAEDKASVLAERLSSENLRSEEALRALAEEEPGVTFLTTPSFARDDDVPGIGRSTAFSVEAFSLAKDAVSEPVRIARGWAILHLADIEEPRLPALEEVRSEVEAEVVDTRLRRVAIDRLAAAALEISDGGSLDQAAEALTVEIEESAPFGRDGTVGSLGQNTAVIEAALGLDEGAIGGPLEYDQGAVLFEVVQRKRFDPQIFAEEKDGTREMLENQRLAELLSALLDQRRQELQVRYDPQILANFGIDQATTGS
jgi:peptidyl-prolyl cis-trans isomerase D